VCVTGLLFLLFCITAVSAQTRVELYSTDFEGPPADWTLTGDFSLAAPGGGNTCQAPHSGLLVLGTNASGDYSGEQSLMDNYAQSPIINIAGASDLRVTYWSFT